MHRVLLIEASHFGTQQISLCVKGKGVREGGFVGTVHRNEGLCESKEPGDQDTAASIDAEEVF